MTPHDRDAIHEELLNRALESSVGGRLAVRPGFKAQVMHAASRQSPRARRSGTFVLTFAVASMLAVSSAVAAIVHFFNQERLPTQYACVECIGELQFITPAPGGDASPDRTNQATPQAVPGDSLQETFRGIAVREDLRIPGDNHKFFDVRVSARGAIAAREGGDGTVRIFSPTGAEIAVVVPSARLTTLYWGWVGDSLWFHTNSRIQVVALAPSPRVVSTRSVPKETPGPPGTTPRARMLYPSIRAMYPNGDLLIRQSFPPEQVRAALGRGDTEDVPSGFLVRTNADHNVVAFVPNRPLNWTDQCTHRSAEPFMFGVVEYSIPRCRGATGSTTSPDGHRVLFSAEDAPVADPAVVRIMQTRFPGDTIYDRRYAIPTAPISAYEADSIRAAQAETIARSPDPRITAFTDSVLKNNFPTHRSPIDDVIVGNDGSALLWLLRFSAAPRFLLLDPEGNPVGTFTLPRGVMILEVSRNHIWGVERRLDTPDSQPWYHVVRYRVGS